MSVKHIPCMLDILSTAIVFALMLGDATYVNLTLMMNTSLDRDI